MEENIRSYKTRVFKKKSDIFPDDFIKKCRDNANEAINIPLGVDKNHKENVYGTRIICTSCQAMQKVF